MKTSYLPYDPQQQKLLPHALQEWLPEEHLAYYISDTVDSLDLNAFHARYANGGSRNQPFHPSVMVKVLIYGYATGVFSSRKLRQETARRCRFPGARCGEFPGTPDDLQFQRLSSRGILSVIRSSGAAG